MFFAWFSGRSLSSKRVKVVSMKLRGSFNILRAVTTISADAC